MLVQKDWTKHWYVLLLNIPISCYHYVPTMRGSTHFLKRGGGRVVEGKFAVMKYLIVSSHVGGRGLYISDVVCDDGSKYILYVSLLIFFIGRRVGEVVN